MLSGFPLCNNFCATLEEILDKKNLPHIIQVLKNLYPIFKYWLCPFSCILGPFLETVWLEFLTRSTSATCKYVCFLNHHLYHVKHQEQRFHCNVLPLRATTADEKKNPRRKSNLQSVTWSTYLIHKLLLSQCIVFASKTWSAPKERKDEWGSARTQAEEMTPSITKCSVVRSQSNHT